MNFSLVLRHFSMIVLIFSGIFTMLGIWSIYLYWQGEGVEYYAEVAFFLSALIGVIGAGSGWWWTRNCSAVFGRREAMLLVACAWLLGGVVAALPFYIWGLEQGASSDQVPFASFVNCYFEAVSGMTTTGSTILPEIKAVPRSMLVWRAMTQWLGGGGIIVLFVAVLPTLGIGSKRLFQVESSGLTSQGVRTSIRETARWLWLFYISATLITCIFLKICGMTWYEAVCHSFTAVSTGGFSTEDASAGVFGMPVKIVLILSMLACGVNFGLYHQMRQKKFKLVCRDTELRAYLGIVAAATVLIVIILSSLNVTIRSTTGQAQPGIWNDALESLFNVVAIQTTTGYGSTDFDVWPFLAKFVLLALMFIGGSTGSTAGGIKVIRIWIAFKIMLIELERAIRPNVVRPLRINHNPLDPDTRLAILAYVVGFGVLFILGTVFIHILEINQPKADLITVTAASAATLCNIGPGFGAVGPTQNFAWFSDGSKLIMCVLMIVGRLEVFPILLLFSPHFWRRN